MRKSKRFGDETYSKYPPDAPMPWWIWLIAIVIVAAVVNWWVDGIGFSLTRAQKHNRAVICRVFGRDCGEALRVAMCESNYHTWARNGQYLGLFQMGSSERRLYGHHYSSPWVQARAAKRYFVASGRDWSPWTCKP